jgi:hypothetical protein
MAYNFLNTTTYSKDLAEQQDLLSYLASAQQTPLGAGHDLSSIDSDLIEMVVGNEQEDAMSPNEDLVEAPAVTEDDFSEEPDDKADMELLNMLFQEEPAAPQRVRTYTPPSPVEDEDEDNKGKTTSSNGRVTPRIWQYGGQPSKYQFGGILYADDYETQRIGLNDPNFNTAVLNLKGTNTIRGLDNHQPVAVTDGSKYKVLNGPQDTAKFSGPVYEQKMKMQTGGSTDSLEKQRVFFERYIKSPKYKERLQKQQYSNTEDIVNSRLNNVRNTKSEITGSGDSYYDMYDTGKVLLDSTDAFYKYYPETVKAHEMGHVAGAVSLGNKNFVMNSSDSAAIAQRNNLSEGHDSRPHEFKADMDTLRYFLRKDKIYDASTQDFTPNVLKKAKQKYKNDPAINRLFKNVKSDEDLIYLMNNIAFNNINNKEIYG